MASEVLQSLTEELAIYSSKAHSYFSFKELLGSSFSKRTTPPIASKRDVTSSLVELELTDVSNALTLRGMLWDMQKDWDKQYDLWKRNPFDQLNVDNLQNSVSHFTQTLYMLEKGSLVLPHRCGKCLESLIWCMFPSWADTFCEL